MSVGIEEIQAYVPQLESEVAAGVGVGVRGALEVEVGGALEIGVPAGAGSW